MISFMKIEYVINYSIIFYSRSIHVLELLYNTHLHFHVFTFVCEQCVLRTSHHHIVCYKMVRNAELEFKFSLRTKTQHSAA